MNVLDGVKVIDFTQGYAGPFCTLQLADFGAEVIKIEKAGAGDASRYWAPFNDENSCYFAMANRGKKSVALDYQSEAGRNAVEQLIKNADILVESFKPGVMEKLGFGYEAIKNINPEILYASISGFGQSGPLHERPAYDNVIQAASGLMDMTGFPEDAPVKGGVSISDSVAALHGALGILMAYYHKMKTGKGQYIEISMFDSLVSILESPILFRSLQGEDVTRCGNGDPQTLVPYDVYRCKDGYFSAGLAGDAGWDNFCKVMEREELIDDPRFKDNDSRCRNFQLIDPVLVQYFADKTKAELSKIFTEASIPNAQVMTVETVMEHPQIVERNMTVNITDNTIGSYEAVGNPMKLSKTPPCVKNGAPFLGEHTEEILKQT